VLNIAIYFCSGRVDGCDESPEISIASTPNSLKKFAFRPSRVRLLPVRSVLRDSPRRPRLNNVTGSTASYHYSKVKDTVGVVPQANALQVAHPNDASSVLSVGSLRYLSAAGRVSPEIPVMGRISRTPKKLNILQVSTSVANSLKDDIISSCETSRIHCSAVSSYCDANDFGLSVSSNQTNSAVICAELLSFRSLPAQFLSLCDDYFYNDCYSLPFMGFDDFSESEAHYFDGLSDLEVSEFDHSVDSCSYFSSDWGIGPRQSAQKSCNMIGEVVQKCSDSKDDFCKMLPIETHQNGVELMTVIDATDVNERTDHILHVGSEEYHLPDHANNTVDLSHEEGHAASVGSTCTREESIRNAGDAPASKCQTIDINENKAVHLCSPPIVSTPDSGCRCWKPVLCITKLSHPV